MTIEGKREDARVMLVLVGDYDIVQVEETMSNVDASVRLIAIKSVGAVGNDQFNNGSIIESVSIDACQDSLFRSMQDLEMLVILAPIDDVSALGDAIVLSNCARKVGAITVFVTMAERCPTGTVLPIQLLKLLSYVDGLIFVHCSKTSADKNLDEPEEIGFYQAVKFFLDFICASDQAEAIALDFSDLCAMVTKAGVVHMILGQASGRNKSEKATEVVVKNPSFNDLLSRAQNVTVYIKGSEEIGLEEVEQVVTQVVHNAQPDANIAFGAAFGDCPNNEINVMVLAADIEKRTVKTGASMLQDSKQIPSKSVCDKADRDEDPFEDILRIFRKLP